MAVSYLAEAPPEEIELARAAERAARARAEAEQQRKEAEAFALSMGWPLTPDEDWP